MGAVESLCRAVGYGGWGAVLLGVLCVMMAVMLGGRRECVKIGRASCRERVYEAV